MSEPNKVRAEPEVVTASLVEWLSQTRSRPEAFIKALSEAAGRISVAEMVDAVSSVSGDPARLMRAYDLVRSADKAKGALSDDLRQFALRIGVTTQQALARFERSGNPIAGSTDPMTAGNGSLMRLAPVAVRHWRDRNRLSDVSARQSKVTHAAPEAVDACAAFAALLADAIGGASRQSVLEPKTTDYVAAIRNIMAGSWVGKSRSQISSSGYVTQSLEAALWCVGRTANFADAVLLAANLGDDADTTAAITGQLAGAIYGASGIPSPWRRRLAWSERIQDATGLLFDASLAALHA